MQYARRNGKCIYVSENLTGRDDEGDLKWIVDKQGVGVWSGLSWPRAGSMAGSYEYNSKLSDYIKV
jgi:hypothetical protein